ncbi:MerR family transcriptional regulator [Xanthobacter tagetidis]|jgi:DNA-binding transcriptional MerR regulator|uniref:MerR family transcriptional regulator n=1 Tax=Xanthobacter tagetidis TaxID=60216 RepID=A0A3L7AKT9_9HYPH|nr:helix-turn-helix domain-containing protein [Xanthobacter tagetidis]MBB6306944.1 DNA-binding transcriptional MerR regulator [Xanthobacter tagetidis]RLP79992.1 MerR family transcriptional regulator [Xanthobacter tagetidis]
MSNRTAGPAHPASANKPPDALQSIGAAARASGVKVPTIRFYEEAGLLPPLPRTEGNRRLYGADAVKRLVFIRHARELGFELDAIRTLLQLQDRPDQSCAEADAIAGARLGEVRRRISALKALEAELAQMVEACAHGRVADCRVIETLADHAHCRFHAAAAGPAEMPVRAAKRRQPPKG